MLYHDLMRAGTIPTYGNPFHAYAQTLPMEFVPSLAVPCFTVHTRELHAPRPTYSLFDVVVSRPLTISLNTPYNQPPENPLIG